MGAVKKCEVCASPATVFLTQIINGKSTKISLCNKCAKDKGILDPSAFDLAEKLMHAASEGIPPHTAIADMQTPQPFFSLTECPACGFTIEDYNRVARLGCDKCYEVFQEEIAPALIQIHGSSTHVGKTPIRASKERRKIRECSTLYLELQKAVEREDYEEAAKLRDAINHINANS